MERLSVPSPKLNLARIESCSEVEGPGKRFVIWTQGCLQDCPGCCNPDYRAIVPNKIMDVDEIIQMIRDSRNTHGIEGVTFLGGEPMLQAVGLTVVAMEARSEGLSVMVFTGYPLDILNSMDIKGVSELLQFTDILLDGPFLKDQLELVRNWAGSTNQVFHYLTNRYTAETETDPAYRHGFELRIAPNGMLRINGWPVNVS